MLKKILIGLVAFVVLALLGGFMMPSSYDVERSVVIERDAATIYPYLSSLKKWPEWTPWTTEKYPKMTTTYSGPESGVGAKSAWTDPDNGNGSMVITAADPAKGIQYDLSFEGWSKSQGRLQMEKAGDGTKIVMGMKGDFGNNPIFRYFGLMMDGAMGAEFESGLTKLKKVVEALPETPPEPQIAEAPYTVEQIRDATKPGRTYKFKVVEGDKPPILRTVQFTKVDETGADMLVTVMDAKGKPQGDPSMHRTTWEGLHAHAHYPKDGTTIAEAEVEVPAGKYACKHYTVTENGKTTEVWFAKDIPGAPVRHEVTQEGATTKTILVEYVGGS